MKQSSNLIGQRLHTARYAKQPRLTQLQLSILVQLEGLDIEQTQISKIESGVRLIRFGWIDFSDWAGQVAQSGQQANLKPEARKYKLRQLWKAL